MTQTQIKKNEPKLKKWYTVKVQNNHEKKVSERLKLEMQREFNEEIQIQIPTQNTVTIKDGKRIYKDQLLYPGYIFVETSSPGSLDALIKTTNGATNILKDNKKQPIVLRDSEVERMLGPKSSQAVLKNAFFTGERVMILTGPFQSFKGTLESVDIENDKVKVEVLIFGRKTMVDLTLVDITKSDE